MSKTVDRITEETRRMQGSALSPESRQQTPVSAPEPSSDAASPERPRYTVLVAHGHALHEPVYEGLKQDADQLSELGFIPVRAIPKRDGSFRFVPFDSPETGPEGASIDLEVLRSAGVTSVIVPAIDAMRNIQHINRLALQVSGPDRIPPKVLEAAGAEATHDVVTINGTGIANYLGGLGGGQISGIRFTTPRADMLRVAKERLGSDCEVIHSSGTQRSSGRDLRLLGVLIGGDHELVAELARGTAPAHKALGIEGTKINMAPASRSNSLAVESGPSAGPPFGSA